MGYWDEYSSYLNGSKTSNNVVINPLNLGEECILINSKKTQYYKYYYTQPTRIINSLLSMYDSHDPRYKQVQDYIDILSDTFDLNQDIVTPRCNCICLVLYFDTSDKLCWDLTKYIPSILQTVINVRDYLPDYIVRIYFDRSVYDTLSRNKSEQQFITILNEQFQQIVNSQNVEVYTSNTNT